MHHFLCLEENLIVIRQRRQSRQEDYIAWEKRRVRRVVSKVLIENQMTRFVGAFDYSSSSVSSDMILQLRFNVDTSHDGRVKGAPREITL